MPIRCPRCDHPAAADAVACAHCGTSLVAPLDLPAIDISKLAMLDHAEGLGLPTPPVHVPSPAPASGSAAHAPSSPGAASASAFAPPAEAFAPPAGLAPPPLVLEPWIRPSSIPAPPPPRPRLRVGGIVAALVAIALVAIAVVALAKRPPRQAPPHAGVSIRIFARPPADVQIDGHAVGKTPLTLQRPPSTTPMLISGPHGAQQIIPDHDQLIDLSPQR